LNVLQLKEKSPAALTFSDPRKCEPYAEALRQAGIEPVSITPDNPRSLDGLLGLVLSGGQDVNPKMYGSAPHPNAEPPDDRRDELEASLLRQALESDLPVLAICRGMQLFNVVHGGTLIQDLENLDAHRVVNNPDRALPAHDIIVQPGSQLAAILGAGHHRVNSRHHQAIERVGAGLRVTATSTPDGVIEALERPDLAFAVAVQWHPEDQVTRDPSQRKLFEAFAQALARA
jgi:putative glutamine amidotransferase